jgi:hypothetical protein
MTQLSVGAQRLIDIAATKDKSVTFKMLFQDMAFHLAIVETIHKVYGHSPTDQLDEHEQEVVVLAASLATAIVALTLAAIDD